MSVHWCGCPLAQVEEDGKRERGASGGGGRFIMSIFADPTARFALTRGRKKRRTHGANLSVVAAPAGRYRWFWAPGGRAYCCTKRSVTGWKVILTVGTSVLAVRFREQVASALATAVMTAQ